MTRAPLSRLVLRLEPETGGWIASFRHASDQSGPCILGQPGERTRVEWAADGQRAVVFEGALFNRDTLLGGIHEREGQTPSAAETVLAAYGRLGEKLFSEMRGVYSIVIWDGASDTLLFGRDPLGIYPLYFTEASGELLLSTSAQALVRAPGVSPRINRALVADHLCHRWARVEETFYEAVRRVPPGHAVRIRSARREVFRHWSIGSVAFEAPRGDEVERFDAALDEAVGHCLSLGPAGIFLSGGIDSVSVAAVAADRARHGETSMPWALSLVFPDPECYEEPIQRDVATVLGLPQVMLGIREALDGQGVLSAAIELSRTWPAPLLNMWLPAYCRLGLEGRARGCRVIVTGAGGDEGLGVSPYLAADFLRELDVLGFIHLWSALRRSYRTPARALLRTLLWRFGLRPLLGHMLRPWVQHAVPSVLAARRRRRVESAMPPWVAPDPALRRELVRRAEESELATAAVTQETGFAEREIRLFFDHPVTTISMEEIFEEGNRIGARVLHPYWDPGLIGLLYRWPPDVLNRGGRSKGLARLTLARRFPTRGFDRQRKALSGSFFRRVVLDEGASAWGAMGGASALGAIGIVDAKLLDGVVSSTFLGQGRRHVHRLWDVLSTEAWLRPRL